MHVRRLRNATAALRSVPHTALAAKQRHVRKPKPPHTRSCTAHDVMCLRVWYGGPQTLHALLDVWDAVSTHGGAVEALRLPLMTAIHTHNEVAAAAYQTAQRTIRCLTLTA
jgi:hypothetical protein